MSDDELNEIKILKQRLDELEKKSIENKLADFASPKSHPSDLSRIKSCSNKNSPQYSFPSSINSDSSEDESPIKKNDRISINSSAHASPRELTERAGVPVQRIPLELLDASQNVNVNETLKEASVTLNKSVIASNHHKRENSGMFFEGDYIKIYAMLNNEKIYIIIPQDCQLMVKEKLSTRNSRTFQYIIQPDMNVVELKKNLYIIDTSFYRDNMKLFENLI